MWSNQFMKFVAVDTEFLREKTYYPQLCLVQVGPDDGEAYAIDPIKGDSLDDLKAILFDPNIIKVFHAGRQDMEIFHELYGGLPTPFFDTQVAAMALGYGESASYASLVQDVCKTTIDKSQQFTDWSIRPLKPAQIEYALNDVVYLKQIYLNFMERLEKQGRMDWITDEMAILTNEALYKPDPERAWERVKIRSDKPLVLSVLRALSAWREREARTRNVPKSRIFKDETLAEMALTMPTDAANLARVRGFPKDLAEKKLGQTILKLIDEASKLPRDAMPHVVRARPFPEDRRPALEMMKMLLRIQCSENRVSARLIATSDDLEELCLHEDKAAVRCLSGWRREVFGEAALALLSGKLSLSVKGGQIIKTSAA